jgi:hypothetical protein
VGRVLGEREELVRLRRRERERQDVAQALDSEQWLRERGRRKRRRKHAGTIDNARGASEGVEEVLGRLAGLRGGGSSACHEPRARGSRQGDLGLVESSLSRA